MKLSVVEKAKEKVFKNLAKGKTSYVISKNYWIHWRKDAIEDNGKYDKITFSLQHHDTITCEVSSYVHDGKLYYYTLDSLDGWFSVSDVRSVNDFLSAFGIEGRINRREEYWLHDTCYKYTDLENPLLDRTIDEAIKTMSRTIAYHHKLSRAISVNVIRKFLYEKVQEAKEREVVRAI